MHLQKERLVWEFGSTGKGDTLLTKALMGPPALNPGCPKAVSEMSSHSKRDALKRQSTEICQRQKKTVRRVTISAKNDVAIKSEFEHFLGSFCR